MFIKEQLRKRDTLWIIRIINRDRGICRRLRYGQRFWRIWGPFIIEWGIQIAVSMAAAVVVMYQYMNAHTKEVVAAYENQAAMMQFATKLMNMMQKYTTIISGATALVVIPVMLFRIIVTETVKNTMELQRIRKHRFGNTYW